MKGYTVEVHKEGCSYCGREKSWVVIDPDGVATGMTYDELDDAESTADMLNEAFERGRLFLGRRHDE